MAPELGAECLIPLGWTGIAFWALHGREVNTGRPLDSSVMEMPILLARYHNQVWSLWMAIIIAFDIYVVRDRHLNICWRSKLAKHKPLTCA